MIKTSAILFFTLGSLLAIADARDEINPKELLRDIQNQYEEIVHDPHIKNGHIKEVLKRKELSMLSPADKKALEKAILGNNIEGGVKWSIKDTVLTIDNPPGFKAGKKLEIDFRDMKKIGSFVIYINGSKFEMLRLAGLGGPGQSDVLGQLDDIEQFIGAKGLQSYLPSLNDRESLWLYKTLRAKLFPFALVSACDLQSVAIGALIIGAGLLLYNYLTKDKSKSVNDNNNHHGLRMELLKQQHAKQNARYDVLIADQSP